MITPIKRHLISAVVTFVSTFLTTFAFLLQGLDPSQYEWGAISSLAVSSVTVATRALIKYVVEEANKS